MNSETIILKKKTFEKPETVIDVNITNVGP